MKNHNKSFFVIEIISILIVISCAKDANTSLPVVFTSTVSSITANSATCGGELHSTGITAYGVCWSISQNPTISDSHTTDVSITGTFISQITGLNSQTHYYVRAYATNSHGTGYGSNQSFATVGEDQLPTVSTLNITNITISTATGGGNVSSQGETPVTNRGLCWSTSQNPTITNSHTSDGSGTGGFTSNITGLNTSTLYFVRAFATNSVGTAYGGQLSFTTTGAGTIPILTTTVISSITQITATGGGNVTSQGSSSVTSRGICWSTSQNPTIANSHTTDGNGMGSFTSNLTGLTANTPYFVMAYATNNTGTVYGNQVSFTTSSSFTCGSSFTINHVASGGVAPINKTVTYGTVTNIPGEISKCWITSNLGADHQATTKDDTTEASAGWYWQFNRKQGYKHDGTTRTPNTTWINSIVENSDWTPANDPCALELGNGWRIPTYTEWHNVNSSGNWITWTDTWNSALKIHAAGILDSLAGSLYLRGSYGFYWSNTQFEVTWVWCLYISSNASIIATEYKEVGLTLRCLKDY